MSLSPFKIRLRLPCCWFHERFSPSVTHHGDGWAVLDRAPCLVQPGLAEAALHGFHLLHFEACSQERGKVSPCLWTEERLVCTLHTTLLTYAHKVIAI